MTGPFTAKLHRPNIFVFVDGTTMLLRAVVRRQRRPGSSISLINISVRYSDAVPMAKALTGMILINAITQLLTLTLTLN